MRHGTQTVVITTSEQANKWLEHFEQCEKNAKADNYANERKKPIKWLTCTCCGDGLQGRDWWNQEPGYGLCDGCVPRCCGTDPGEYSQTYGVRGVHYLIPKEERDNPPLVVDRGEPLYGLDERLRIEYDGYVYWKGHQIEHYSGRALYDTDENKQEAKELIRRCESLEQRGEEISSVSVIWKWSEA